MSNSLQQAILAIQSGDKERGRQLLSDVILANPRNETAWMWMSAVAENEERERYCLGRVLSINPNNQAAQEGLRRLQPATPKPKAPAIPEAPIPEPPPSTTSISPFESEAPPVSIPGASQAKFPAFLEDDSPSEQPLPADSISYPPPGLPIVPPFEMDDAASVIPSALPARSPAFLEDDQYPEQTLPAEFIPNPPTSVSAPQPPPAATSSIEAQAAQPPAPAVHLSWWRTWLKALTRPNITSYQAIINDPLAGTYRGLSWVFSASLIYYLFLLGMGIFRIVPIFEWLNLKEITLSRLFPYLLIGWPILAAVVTLIFAIAQGVVNIAAKLLRGQGSYDHLVYASSAFSAPMLLITGMIAVIPTVNLLGLLTGLYTLFLQLISIRAVHKFGWGRSIVALLAPAILIIAGVGVAILFLGSPAALLDTLRRLTHLD